MQDLPALPVLEGLARLHQAVFVSDAEGKHAWISDALGALRGSGPTQGDHEWRRTGSSHDRYFAETEQLAAIRRSFLRDGHVHAAPAELKGCDGRRIPVEIDLVRALVPDGPPVVVGIVRPTAEREQRAREQRATTAFLSGVLASSPAPVIALDRRGFISYANPAVEALLGHAADELLGKPLAMLAPSPALLAQAVTGSAERDKVELRHADGGTRQVTLSASELRVDDEARGSVIVVHDHTAERDTVDDLCRKNDELEHYVQNVTHDLRSPLVSLLGFSRLLRQEYGDGMDETARHFLDRIEKAGHSMEALINDLLELSRIDSARQYKAHVNVNDVLLQLKAELKPRLESQAVRLTLPDRPSVVLCDRTRLYQVFSNLIGNALDYMGPVSDAEIAISVAEESGEHRIVVSDNGRGIEPSQAERIFELFQSAGPRVDGRRGTGIGLAIVKKIAQSQGGRVWVESRPGQGAAFHLTLPRD